MVRSIKSRLILTSLSGLLAALCFSAACGTGTVGPDTAPTPAPVPSNSASQSGCGNIQGNGNTVNCNTVPTPTPTPAGSGSTCFKEEPLYQQNVVIAESRIQPGQSQASYLSALVVALKAAGFKVFSGKPLSEDEISVKLSDFSETYDFWRSDNTPQVLYLETCRPAIF